MRRIFFHGRRNFTVAATAALLCASFLPAAVHAQGLLPSLPEPPAVGGLLGDLERTAEDLRRRTDRQLEGTRRQLIDSLLRQHRDVLERGPGGELVVRGELTALSPSAEALAAARDAGFTLLREQRLAGLQARVVVLRAPERWSTRRALRRLQRLDPEGAWDFNHVYLPVAAAMPRAVPEPGESAGVTATPPGVPGATPLRVGLVDGGIDTGHEAFAGLEVHAYGCDGEPVPSRHGTAVASLLVGSAAGFRGAAPGATLHAADVYCGRATGGAADAFAAALGQLAERELAVISTSIVGPANRLLGAVIDALVGRGIIVVAAVGNDGPAARPLYPAAYPGVVAVTGVRADRRVLPEAGRGPHVDFAAPAADMLAAGPDGAYAEVRGTSYAAPLVAGLLAAKVAVPDPEAARLAVAALARDAIDLGRRGRDEVYGDGLVGEALRVAP